MERFDADLEGFVFDRLGEQQRETGIDGDLRQVPKKWEGATEAHYKGEVCHRADERRK
jgi:hypothetical protein